MARRLAFYTVFSALALHAVLALQLVPAPQRLTDALYLAIELGSVALVVARAVAVKRNRAGWALIAFGLGLWVAGDCASTLGAESASDLLYIGMFVGVYVALALLLRDRVRPFPAWLTIDGILAGLTLAALASTAFAPLQSATARDAHTVAMSLVSLGCDLLLLVVVLVGFAATAWRPGRSWWLLGGGLA